MLFTRCPECHTTFRITNEALEKADGRVRCGRCSNIFNAYAELREQPQYDSNSDAARSQTTAASEQRSSEREAPATRTEHVILEAPAPLFESGAAPEAARESRAAAVWTLESVADLPPKRSLGWGIGASAAALVLLAQAVHHFRADLADRPVVGGWLSAAYAVVGIDLEPHWNVEQYEILNWGATSETGAGGQGNLVIRSRIQNTAARSQPYPLVHLKLLDRWEEAVGTRVFRPSEYLAAATGGLMPAGDTAEAELIVVDPGPDAYGFELDVCVETEQRIECANDRIFR